MNQTGLSVSMVPSVSSLLFQKSPYEDSFIKSTVKEIPTTVFSIKKNKIPISFDIMPLIKKPQTVEVPAGRLIPVCTKCGAFPNEFCRFSEMTWKCGVCGTVNHEKDSHILPDSSDYQIITQKKELEKPLFLFILQTNGFFSPCIKQLSKSIFDWCHMEQNKGVEVSLVTIDEKITLYDMKRSLAHVLVDVDDFSVPVCEAQDVSFELNSSNSSKNTTNLFNHVSSVLKSIPKRKYVNVVLMADSEFHAAGYADVLEFFKDETRILHFFTTKTSSCHELALLSYRVRLFDSNEASIVAPVLLNWLQSSSLFGTSVRFYYNPSCYNNNFITTRYSHEGDSVLIPFIDGESSFSIETTYKRGSSCSSVFQVSLIFTLSNGVSGMRVISWRVNQAAKLTSLDGVCIGVQLARDCANSLQIDQQQKQYGEFFDSCIEMVSAWSEDGAYIKSIDQMFRDIPILMYAITKSKLFCDNPIEVIAAKINFLTMSVSRVCRSLYPVLILPPLKFPHRLTKDKSDGFDAVLLIGPFSGKAFGSSELLSSVEVINVPFIMEDKIESIADDLIEDLHPSFACFNEKIEIECNGKRFI